MEAMMNAYCDKIRDRADRSGQALFPGDADQFSHMVFLPMKDIEADLAQRDFKVIAPVVYGCINYQSAHTTGVCQTRFAYMVVNASDDRKSALAMMPSDSGWLQRPVYLVHPGNIITAD